MDPGNWATDLAGGARYGYTLLSVIMLSNLMAILLQALSARLGIASGRDLAQACRDHYSRPTTLVLWVLCEIAIAACDLAEVIGVGDRAEPAVRPAADVGRLPDVARRAARPLAAAVPVPLRRGARRAADRRDRRVASRSSWRWRGPTSPACSAGCCRRTEIVAQPRHALHRRRHPRRDGDAAQPVPALVDRPDAQVRRRRRRAGARRCGLRRSTPPSR